MEDSKDTFTHAQNVIVKRILEKQDTYQMQFFEFHSDYSDSGYSDYSDHSDYYDIS